MGFILIAIALVVLAFFLIRHTGLLQLEADAEDIKAQLEASVTKTEEERKAVVAEAVATLEKHFPKYI